MTTKLELAAAIYRDACSALATAQRIHAEAVAAVQTAEDRYRDTRDDLENAGQGFESAREALLAICSEPEPEPDPVPEPPFALIDQQTCEPVQPFGFDTVAEDLRNREAEELLA